MRYVIHPSIKFNIFALAGDLKVSDRSNDGNLYTRFSLANRTITLDSEIKEGEILTLEKSTSEKRLTSSLNSRLEKLKRVDAAGFGSDFFELKVAQVSKLHVYQQNHEPATNHATHIYCSVTVYVELRCDKNLKLKTISEKLRKVIKIVEEFIEENTTK